MTDANDVYSAMLGEEPDARRCVALSVNLRVAIIEQQIILQRELRHSGAGGAVNGSTFSTNVDATTSVLGIPVDTDTRSDVHAPAAAAQRLVILRSELTALRERIAATTELVLPTPSLAIGFPSMHLVMALPEQYVATLLDLSDDEIELAWLAVAWALQPALFDDVILDVPARGVSAALFVRLRRFTTTIEEHAFVVALRTSKLVARGLLQRQARETLC